MSQKLSRKFRVLKMVFCLLNVEKSINNEAKGRNDRLLLAKNELNFRRLTTLPRISTNNIFNELQMTVSQGSDIAYFNQLLNC